MAQTDYPRVLYHTAIKHRRNVFGRIIDNGEPVQIGDQASPNYPVPVDAVHANSGTVMGPHIVPQHPYKTTIVVVYNGGGGIDEEKSKAAEAELVAQGWVRHPSELKEEYED